jgi:hypothetical protein
MDWKKERDLLIAQTMAFVQSVNGKKPETARTADAARTVSAAPVAVTERATEITDLSEQIRIETQTPRRIAAGGVRAEIQDRVANFRAHQQRFHREREEYFSATLARLRAKLADDSAPLR